MWRSAALSTDPEPHIENDELNGASWLRQCIQVLDTGVMSINALKQCLCEQACHISALQVLHKHPPKHGVGRPCGAPPEISLTRDKFSNGLHVVRELIST
jgi:hypothetical protein